MTYNGGNGAADNSLSTYKVVRVGDIAFEGHTNKEHAYGRFVLNDAGDGLMSPRFSCLRPIVEQRYSFWKHYIPRESMMRPVLVNATKSGTMMNELVPADLMRESILVPVLYEQEAIGRFFKQLDALITLHQRKCRYRGLCGYLSWEQRKFSELATLRRGLTYSPANIRPYGQGVRVLRSSNIAEDEFVLSREDVFVDEDVVKMDLAQDDEILITAANGSPRLVGKRAKIHDLAGKTVHGGFMLCARAEQPDFVVALMGSQWYQRFLATGVAGGNGSIGNLDKEALENETALIPRTEEQRLIGAHFSRLDALITLHQ